MMTLKQILENKEVAKLQKLATLKQADVTPTVFFIEKENKTETVKNLSDTEIPENGKFNVKVAINTTNIVDSHMDLHVNGLWKKSVKESKGLYLFQEHKYQFDKVISDKVTASTTVMSWKELGYKYEGDTEVLLFDAEIDPTDNELMANKYKQGKVKNHSVGMRYVKIALCINSEEKYDQEEKANWDKYYPMVANKEVIEDAGYFWAVTEAKIIEGSAVPIGSNTATPTIEVSESKSSEAVIDTSENEPLQNTQEKLTSEDVYRELRKLFNN